VLSPEPDALSVALSAFSAVSPEPVDEEEDDSDSPVELTEDVVEELAVPVDDVDADTDDAELEGPVVEAEEL
jgi:hypothetical protein